MNREEKIAALRAARDLLSDPKKVTTGSYARGANGLPVDPWRPTAVSFCGVGALAKVTSLDPDIVEDTFGLSVEEFDHEIATCGPEAAVDFFDQLIEEEGAL